jgi:hypothetical protein
MARSDKVHFDKEDWIGNSSELLDRLRPFRPRYDIALPISAIALGLCLVWAAEKLKTPAPYQYEFQSQGDIIRIFDHMYGRVAACRNDGIEVVCGEGDSASDAFSRALETKYSDPDS